MTNTNMTLEQENAFYAEPDNQVPEGPPVRRRAKLSDSGHDKLPGDGHEAARWRT